MTLCDIPNGKFDTWKMGLPKNARVLILTASFGEGHNAAAKGLQMAFEERECLNLSSKAHIVDICAIAYPRLNRIVRWAYLKAIHHFPKLWKRVFDRFDAGMEKWLGLLKGVEVCLEKEIKAFSPDAIICTFPFYNQMIDRLYTSSDKVPFKRFTVVTDSICINSIWAKGNSDFYIVPNRPTLEALKAHGVPLSSILDLGFPVSLKFANCQIPRNVPPPWNILYMPGGSKAKIEENIRQLSAMSNVELTIATGKNVQACVSLQRFVKQISSSAKVIGWVDDMPERLLRQHLVIGKAGGAIVQETIAAGCPMIISQVVPGQEEGNISLILQQGVGAVAEEPEQLQNLLSRAMQNEGALWRTWKSNLLAIQRPLAAQTIARFVLGRLCPRQDKV